jgi:hypothetical protein
LGQFIDKKRREYDGVRQCYPGLYQAAGERFLERHSSAVIRRSATLGHNIAEKWESGPDESPCWRPLAKALGARNIDVLRKIPIQLKNDGKSVTWAAMRERIPPPAGTAANDIQIAIQHYYTGIYLEEYHATIIGRAPPKTTELHLQACDISFDYYCFRDVLQALELWRLIGPASALTILALRYRYGYQAFVRSFEQACLLLQRVDHVVGIFGAIAYHMRKGLIQAIRRINSTNKRGDNELDLAPAELDAIEEYLVAIAEGARSRGDMWGHEEKGLRQVVSKEAGGVKMKKVFVVHGHDTAVKNEIDIFLRENRLEPVVMDRAAMAGRTLLEKFESMAADCDDAVVIATPDDQLVVTASRKPLTRFRQNVVLEIGYFWGRLGREGKFSLLVKQEPSLDIPSDLQGLGWIPITDDLGQTKLRLRADLESSGVL